MKLPLSLFLAITSLTSTTKLSTNLNVGIVLCHENILCGKSEFLTAQMIDSPVDTTLTCVDCPGLFRAQDAEVSVTEGPDRSNFAPIGGQDFLMFHKGEIVLKGF